MSPLTYLWCGPLDWNDPTMRFVVVSFTFNIPGHSKVTNLCGIRVLGSAFSLYSGTSIALLFGISQFVLYFYVDCPLFGG